jgi:DNA-binding NarL/FixJ family response regulator
MAIRLLLVDDHGVVRQGLRMYLSTDPEMEVVGEACDGAEAVALARQLRPDVIVMDLLMPGMDGAQATRIIRQENPGIEVVALTSVLGADAVVDAIQAGAISYLLKTAESRELLNAVRAAAARRSQFSSFVAAMLMESARAADAVRGGLTDREIDVLRLIADGRSNREIAQALHLSEQTVKSHVSHILRKLDLTSRTQAAMYARERGLTSRSDPRAEGRGV